MNSRLLTVQFDTLQFIFNTSLEYKIKQIKIRTNYIAIETFTFFANSHSQSNLTFTFTFFAMMGLLHTFEISVDEDFPPNCAHTFQPRKKSWNRQTKGHVIL
jgi:hypothetical protein